MEGFIVLFVVAVFVLGIKWFVSYDKSRREDLNKDRLKREEAIKREEVIKARAKPATYSFKKEDLDKTKEMSGRVMPKDVYVVDKETLEILRKPEAANPNNPEEMGYQIGERGGRYEIRYSKRTGKPYRHYF